MNIQKELKYLLMVTLIVLVAVATLGSPKEAEAADYGCVGEYIPLRYRAAPGLSQNGPTQWKTTNYLKKGSSGDAVKYVQWILVEFYGYDLGNYGPRGDGIDGYFGSLTTRAIVDLQVKYINSTVCGRKLTWHDVDGVVGPQTWTLLMLDDIFQ